MNGHEKDDALMKSLQSRVFMGLDLGSQLQVVRDTEKGMGGERKGQDTSTSAVRDRRGITNTSTRMHKAKNI